MAMAMAIYTQHNTTQHNTSGTCKAATHQNNSLIRRGNLRDRIPRCGELASLFSFSYKITSKEISSPRAAFPSISTHQPMARSFTNVNFLSALLSNALTRRGYAAATQSAIRGGGASISGKIGQKSAEDKVAAAEKVSWVPDPVTGYYKPENIKENIDVAELRATLLGKKFNH